MTSTTPEMLEYWRARREHVEWLSAAGMPQKEIAVRIDVSPPRVRQILANQRYRRKKAEAAAAADSWKIEVVS